MKLIDDWKRQLHKLWTMRLAALGTVVGLAADFVPQLQGVLPDKWYIAVFLLIAVLRMISQKGPSDDPR